MTRFTLILAACAFIIAAPALAQQKPLLATRALAPHMEPPTLISLGYEWPITGDDNRNAAVSVAYRKVGETAWRDGLAAFRLQNEKVNYISFNWTVPNMFAGSLFDLSPDTAYQIRLRLTHPDGVTGTKEYILAARTRGEPMPAVGGKVYHVYPRDFTGPKLEPNFPSLMAAYNTGVSGTDFVNTYAPRVKAGDIILVHAGTYKENRQLYGARGNSTLFDGAFYLTVDGTREKPIVIKAAGDGEVIFDGQGAPVLFDMTAADYNYVEGITVRNTEVAFLLGRKRIVGSVGFTLKHSRLENVGRGVFTDWGGARDFYIADNVFVGRSDPNRLMGWQGKVWQGIPGFPQPLTSELAIKVFGSGHVIAYNKVTNFHDGIDHATYGNLDEQVPVSNDIYGNDISNVDDNCIEADGSAYNMRVFRNRCFNHGHGALSTQPVLGGPAYFIRNIVYHAPELGALKLTANATGAVYYNNTFLTEVHQNGVVSNVHFRNNLILGQGDWPEVFSIETYTRYSSSDYNGFAPAKPGPSLFAWDLPASGKVVDYTGERPVAAFASLAAYAAATGQDQHSVMVDWSIFTKASPPNPTDPTHVYRPQDFDFTLKPGAAAIDRGIVLPGVTDGYTGAAPDLGALEAGAPAFHYGPRG
jgi:hypothetical protein